METKKIMEWKKEILIVDDERFIVKGIKFNLERDGMNVTCVYDGAEALGIVKTKGFDLILLDIMLPKMDGMDLCRSIREFYDTPIIILSAKNNDMDKIMALEMGADDYITKPFNIIEVKARMCAVMRRNRNRRQNRESVFGDLIINYDNHQVLINDQVIDITLKEFALLELLSQNPDKIYTREKLLSLIWGQEFNGDIRTVDVHIRRLRIKIEKNSSDPKFIKTKWGVGYYFQAL